MYQKLKNGIVPKCTSTVSHIVAKKVLGSTGKPFLFPFRSLINHLQFMCPYYSKRLKIDMWKYYSKNVTDFEVTL